MNKFIKISLVAAVVFSCLYVLLLLVTPSGILLKFFHLSFNDTARVDEVFYKYIKYFIFFSAGLAVFLWIKQSRFSITLAETIKNLTKNFSRVFTLSAVLVICCLYLAVLYYLAITHYDFGFDEAWYVFYAKNFASTGMPFYGTNGKIAVIDTITMLPYYLLSLINFKTGLTDVIYFKALSSIVSILTLFVLYRVCLKLYGKFIAVISLLILIVQPGFGFIASSFFGELTQAAFLFLGLYLWLRDDSQPNSKTILTVSLLFSLAIHTKFQLLFILVLALVFLQFTDSNKKALKILIYTLAFTILIILLRAVPIILYDWKLIKNQALITDLIAAPSGTLGAEFVFDKIQKFNRYFPVGVVFVSLGIFVFIMRTAFERFLFFYSAITTLWWIFLYPASTYRNPFMGIVSLAIIIAIMIKKLFDKSANHNPVIIKYTAAIVVMIIMLWGFSSNIIFAYIGYNDGVEYDIDAARNRLFFPLAWDNSQQQFHAELKKIVSPADTLYNGTFVTHCYTNNPIADLSKLKESLGYSSNEKFVLVTREIYPFGIEKGYKLLDTMNFPRKLILKKGDFELYTIVK